MWKYVILLIFVTILGVGWYFFHQLKVANGYAAKIICTCTLANGRSKEIAEKQHLYFSILSLVNNDVDTINKEVKSSFWGLSTQVAQFRRGIGCILLDGKDDYNVRFPFVDFVQETDTIAFPYGNREQLLSTKGLDKEALGKAVNEAFDIDGEINKKRTTAVLVIHSDTLVAEKYAKTFSKDTPQLGWSMTKSFMNTYVGLLVNEGKLNIKNNQLFKEWQNDERKNLTLNDLLHMNTGLEWEENYAKVSDATKMLYTSEDISTIALTKKLEHSIGTHWYYSSGTSNLISRYLRNHLNGDKDYHTYLKNNLFNPLLMASAFIETDESGNFIGSSYGYATPRDWAKFGLLYLHDGIWKGKRLLPVGWTAYTREEANGSNGKYGAHFWLNTNGVEYPDAPYDLYSANGFQGQYVFIIPSRNVVIVRMGTGGEGFDANLFIKNVLAAIPKNSTN